ncbi:hypothetical protein SK128_016416, partial [Halocaridina rubra]
MRVIVFTRLLIISALVGLYKDSFGQTLDPESTDTVSHDNASNLWSVGEVELRGNNCYYLISPVIKRWKLYFNSSLWCPRWTPIQGS